MITVVSLNPAIDRILPVNELLPGLLHRDIHTLITPGGKGINAARVLKQLGADVCVSGLSGGENGRWIYNQLQKQEIKVFTVNYNEETRVNTNIIGKGDPPEETELLECGTEIGKDIIRKFKDCFLKSIENASLIVISGSLPAGVSADIYKELIHIAKDRGLCVILDTSGPALQEAIKEAPLIIKPNNRELSQLTGRNLQNIEDRIKACKDILSSGIGAVFLSMGGEGALAVSNSGVYKAMFPAKYDRKHFKVRNTIGSGDAMVAGISYVISEASINCKNATYKMDKNIMLEVLKTGMACGISNTAFLEIGCISKEAVAEIRESVVINEL